MILQTYGAVSDALTPAGPRMNQYICIDQPPSLDPVEGEGAGSVGLLGAIV
jgi:hypothetical protein